MGIFDELNMYILDGIYCNDSVSDDVHDLANNEWWDILGYGYFELPYMEDYVC